ncbi:MAG: hypothetical protein JRH16_02900 [Deltaproteobacteria bacterium]|nr:hypothetical protein [Deltaproteobacteria bacterium]
MSNSASRRQFEDEVFPAELEEIRRRREAVGLVGSDLEGPPSAHLGLHGLAFSGGGIRSATFCLGVLEAAANAGLLKRADYLSTVSGGGYTGSCLSSVLNDPTKKPEGRDFPFHHELGVEEPAAYRHLRNGSNYLAPGGVLEKLRLPALVLRGILLNFLLFLPIVMLAVVLTELVYEFGTRSPFGFHVVPLTALGFFGLLVLTFPPVTRALRRRMVWSHRDRYEQILTCAFAVSLVLLFATPLALLVVGAAGGTWEGFREAVRAELASPFEGRDYWKWLVALLVVVGFLFAGQASERVEQLRGRLGLYLVGLLAPSVLLVIYLVLCAYQLDSPFLSGQFAGSLDRAVLTSELRAELGQRGVELGPDAMVLVQKPGKAWAIRDGEDELHISTKAAFLRIDDRDLWDGPADFAFFALWIGLLSFNLIFMDVNLTSPHGFYRDRLSRVFLFRTRKDGGVESNDGQKLSDLNGSGTQAPYHLINTALNLHGSRDPNLRGRNADFFIFSKHHTGSHHTGYCRTTALEELDGHLDLGTAMAVSGAAAAPNMGVTTVPPLVFLMTLLNIRLGYWLPNPSWVRDSSGLRRLLLRRGAGPLQILRESISGLHHRGSQVNVSDGGHLENLAVYELLRRRCSFIASIDAGADPHHRFGALVRLIRFAKIDMGIKIEIDLADLEKDEQGACRKHWAVGTIRYGDDQVGHLLYIKASLSGDENLYVREYAEQNPTFPHQSTANQFFTETQFEAYRALGFHAASRAIEEHRDLAGLVDRQAETPGE